MTVENLKSITNEILYNQPVIELAPTITQKLFKNSHKLIKSKVEKSQNNLKYNIEDNSYK